MRNIIISGSASGIGEATSKRLQAQGDRVIGIDLKDADIIANLATRDGRNHAIAEALEMTNSEIDGVVLCAGVSGLFTPADMTLSLNYFGSVDLLDGLRPAMEGRPNSCAIGLVSNASQFGVDYDDPMVAALLEGDEDKCREMILACDFGAAYRFTKHALARVIRRRAVEWGPLGVRVCGIVPGVTETPMVKAIKDDPMFGGAVDMVPRPLGRNASADEIAGVIEFMLSDAAAYISGSMIWVDGGTDAAVRPDRF